MTDYKDTGESLVPERDEALRHNHRKPLERRLLMLRNVLNIIFMVTAVTGVYFYLKVDERQGIIIVLVAMAIKLLESAIRIQTKLLNK